MKVLVDSNVLVDVLTQDPVWAAWSESAIARWQDQAVLVLCPIVLAELAVGFERAEEIERVLPPALYLREDLPWEAAFLAGRCHARYRRQGGRAPSPLPDFLIGAHAAVRGHRLLTRDARRYRTYFPSLAIIAPAAA